MLRRLARTSSRSSGTEHVVLGHLGRRGRDVEQAGALLGRQQGTAGHRTSGR